jgi:hypothetical protein
MNSAMLSAGLIVAAVVCLGLGVFYIVPGPYHPFTFSGTPTGSHVTHALGFVALAVVAFLGSRFVRNSAQ